MAVFPDKGVKYTAEALKMSGIVLQSAPYGEYDRRLILLTKEAGKITAFARGARKPTSPLVAATTAFNMGTFLLYPGRTAYTLGSAEISNYFSALKADLDASCYGAYFMELAGYYGRENLDAVQMLNLLYVSLRALENPALPRRLVRCVYEIRLMVINGEFPVEAADDASLGQSGSYAVRYAVAAPLGKLFTFNVTDEVLDRMRMLTRSIRERTIDTKMKSLDILETMVEDA